MPHSSSTMNVLRLALEECKQAIITIINIRYYALRASNCFAYNLAANLCLLNLPLLP